MSIVLLLRERHEAMTRKDRRKGWLRRAQDRVRFIRQLQEEGNQ